MEVNIYEINGIRLCGHIDEVVEDFFQLLLKYPF